MCTPYIHKPNAIRTLALFNSSHETSALGGLPALKGAMYKNSIQL